MIYTKWKYVSVHQSVCESMNVKIWGQVLVSVKSPAMSFN